VPSLCNRRRAVDARRDVLPPRSAPPNDRDPARLAQHTSSPPPSVCRFATFNSPGFEPLGSRLVRAGPPLSRLETWRPPSGATASVMRRTSLCCAERNLVGPCGRAPVSEPHNGAVPPRRSLGIDTGVTDLEAAVTAAARKEVHRHVQATSRSVRSRHFRQRPACSRS
jgi:hypothetical protein